jgi:Ca-activated chloride channel family protein
MKTLFFFTCLFLFSCCLSAQKPENTAGQYLFILDASGSMWQQIGGEHKIAIAKSVMKNLINQLDDNTVAGLIAYGHNRKDDCNDIQTLAALAPLNKAAFNAKLVAIDPKGKTPIAQSITHALAHIRATEGAVTIILVSDGLETCEGNACDLVKNAKAQGVKITLHVVGFGITEQDLASLECLAQAGGGQYFPADNAADLAQALEQSVEAPVQAGGYLSVKTTIDNKLIDATVRVYKSGQKDPVASGRTYAGPETNPRTLLLAPGTYELDVAPVKMDGDPVQRLNGLTIAMNDTLFREVNFTKGNFEILVTRNAGLSDATVSLYKSGTKELVASTRTYQQPAHNPAKFAVLPGLYDVEIKSVEIAGRTSVRIEKQMLAGGSLISLAHDFKSGELKVGARQGTALVDATIGVYSQKTGESIAAGRTYLSDTSNPKTFILEPGEYEVRLASVKPAGLGKKTLTAIVKEKGSITITGEW